MAVKKKGKRIVTQICTGKCKKELPLTDFYKDGTDKNGPRYRKECKKCYNERRKERDMAKQLATIPEMTVKHIE